jgi:hypothetical protein
MFAGIRLALAWRELELPPDASKWSNDEIVDNFFNQVT